MAKGIRVLKESDGLIAGAIRSETTGSRIWTLPNRNAVLGENSPRFFTTSGAGAVDDSVIDPLSPTYGTDNTTSLQNLLNESENGPIVILWDGHYKVTNIKVRSNTHILCMPGCGIIQTLGTVGPAVKVASDAEPKSSSSGGYGSNIDQENVIIDGMKILAAIDNESVALVTIGTRNIVIKNCTFIDPRFFATTSNNCENALWDNNHVLFTDTQSNHDGLHFSAYHRNITVRNTTLDGTTDDGISFNNHESASAGANGPMYDILVDGLTLNKTQTGKDYGVAFWLGSNNIDNAIVRNIKGTTNSHFVRVGNWTSSGGRINRLTIDGVSGVFQGAVGAAFRFDGTSVQPQRINITNYNIEFDNINGVLVSVPLSLGVNPSQLRSLSLSQGNVYISAASDSSGTASPFINIPNNANPRNIKISNLTIDELNSQVSSGKSIVRNLGYGAFFDFVCVSSGLPKIFEHNSTFVSPTVQITSCFGGYVSVGSGATIQTLNAQGHRFPASLGAFVQGAGAVTNNNQVNVQAV